MEMEVLTSNKFHLLEINLISAQELNPPNMARTMRTYVVAWIDPKHKLKSQIDSVGRQNPTWNDKFVFLTDDVTAQTLNSVLVFEIYSSRSRLGKDRLLGTSRVLIDSLVNCSNRYYEGMRGSFRAVQIRRSSGDPGGILNIGINILEGLSCQVLMKQSNYIVGKTLGFDHKTLMGLGGPSPPIAAAEKGGYGGARGETAGMMSLCYCCGLIPAKARMKKKVSQWRALPNFNF